MPGLQAHRIMSNPGLADTPKGQHGRPCQSLTLNQAVAVMTAARTLPVMELRPGLKDVRRPAELMHAYITLSLLCGLRTEEARALRWAHVDLDGDPAASPPAPPHVAVWRSVRAHGETKTERSRRTLGLPAAAVQALRALRQSQADERLAAGEGWQDTGLVFTTHRGAALDARNVLRSQRPSSARSPASPKVTQKPAHAAVPTPAERSHPPGLTGASYQRGAMDHYAM